MKAALLLTLLTASAACGASDASSLDAGARGSASARRLCQAHEGGCSCGGAARGTATACSESLLGSPSLCCERGDTCDCDRITCASRDNGRECSCGIRSAVLQPGDFEGDVCFGRRCCKSTTSLACTCGDDITCGPDEEHVMVCTLGAIACSADDTPTDICND